jgi:hypothetical protein
MPIKLYYAPGACSLASHLALEEVGVPYETVRLDLAAGGYPGAGIWCRRRVGTWQPVAGDPAGFPTPCIRPTATRCARYAMCARRSTMA